MFEFIKYIFNYKKNKEQLAQKEQKTEPISTAQNNSMNDATSNPVETILSQRKTVEVIPSASQLEPTQFYPNDFEHSYPAPDEVDYEWDYKNQTQEPPDDVKTNNQINTKTTSKIKPILGEFKLDESNTAFMEGIHLLENTKKSLFLTGKAGTGKSTFLRYFCSITKKKHIILAPTGVAAVNAGGQTLHSFFHLGFSFYKPNDNRLSEAKIYETLKFKKESVETIRTLDMIIIDEISMVRCDIIDAIDQILRTIRRKNFPFGGVQMVFIGDPYQLAPIAQPKEWSILSEYYPNEFFFCANVLNPSDPNSLKYEYIELDKIYRQNDPNFINLLNKVRENKLTQSDYELLSSHYRFNLNEPPEGYITLATHKKNVDTINSVKLSKLETTLYEFRATISGVFPVNNCPADELLSVKVGSQIILLRNDPARRFYNGSLGIVENIEIEKSIPIEVKDPITGKEEIKYIIDDVITVRLFDNDNTVVPITRYKWENIEYTKTKSGDIEGKVIGTFIQFPVKLAWAMTIHKSQGLTFDKVIIDAGHAFAHGQTYVALSRCTSLEGMLLRSRISARSVITDQNVISFVKEQQQKRISF